MGMGVLKREIRILGFDDAPFRFHDEKTELIGVIFRGGSWMEGVVTGYVDVDGRNAGERIVEIVGKTPHRGQVRVIMLDGITFGGFNVADIGMIRRKTGIPVIAVVRKKPGLKAIRSAIRRFGDWETRWRIIERAGEPKPVKVVNAAGTGTLWFQASGIGEEDAAAVIRLSCTRALIPEPLRVAHMIASGMKGMKWKETRKPSHTS
jgi:endonuclease V-like protein UPF0215 family